MNELLNSNFTWKEKQNISKQQFERMYNDNNNAKNASFIWRGLFITFFFATRSNIAIA